MLGDQRLDDRIEITDHDFFKRINLTLYALERIMIGDLDPVIEPLITQHQASLLAEEGL